MIESSEKYSVGQFVRATLGGSVVYGTIKYLDGEFLESKRLSSSEVELLLTKLTAGVISPLGDEFRLNTSAWSLEVLS